MVNRAHVIFVVGLLVGLTITGAALTLSGSDGVEVSDGVPLSSPNNNTVVLNGNTNVSLENFAPSSDTVELITEDGNMTVSSAGDTHLAVLNTAITGSQTKLTNIEAGSTYITANPEDKAAITFRGDLTELYWSDFTLDDGNEDVFINGPAGTGTIRSSDFPGSTTIKAVDLNSNTILDKNTTEANGEATFDIGLSSHSIGFQTTSGDTSPQLSNFDPSDGSTIRTRNPTLSVDVADSEFDQGDSVTVDILIDGSVVDTQTINSNQTVTYSASGLTDGAHTWSVEATDSFGATTTSGTKNFEVRLFDPSVTNLSPTGLLDYEPSTLSADVSDPDFGKSWGDTVTVEIYLDNTLIDTQNIYANQTVSTSIPQSGQMGGEHTYRFEVSDSYGYSDDASASYSTPANFTIRNELNHSEIVSDPVNTTITFYGDQGNYERFTSTGVINMTGLPVNQEFVVELNPSDGNWTDRVVYVSDIYEQQEVYLLNTSVTDTVTNRFVLDDSTGQYSSESVLKIQRTVNVSGSEVWRTIHADQFGVEGVTATLDAGVRHRIIVRNQDGDEQVVGPYRAEVTETVSVEPSSASIDLPPITEGIVANATMDGQTVEYALASPNDLDKVTVEIYEKNNQSNTLISPHEYFNTQSVSDSFSISTNESEKRWVVKFSIEDDGETTVITREIGNKPDLASSLGGQWATIIGVGMLFLLAGAFSVLNAAVGAMVVSIMGGILWWLGILGGATSGVAIVIAMVISAAVHIRSGSGP